MAPTQKPGRSKQDYATPIEFIRATTKLLGIDGFWIDLAAEPSNTVSDKYYTKEDDALVQDWSGIPGWAWLNPPFRHIAPWAKKASESGNNIAMLVPASVGSNWWVKYVHRKAKVLFLNGRIAFMRDKPKWLYPKDCALVLFGKDIVPSYGVWKWKG